MASVLSSLDTTGVVGGDAELVSLSYFLTYESHSKGLSVSGIHLPLGGLLVKRSETGLPA